MVPAVEVGLMPVRLPGEPAVVDGVSIQVTDAVLGADRTARACQLGTGLTTRVA